MAKLKELREKRFITQEELAKRSGRTTSTINRLENGKQQPRLGTRREIAKALDVDPADVDF